MKYQALKHLKTTSKILKLCDTLAEARSVIEHENGAKFQSLSYIGGFPVFSDGKYNFSIQGTNDTFGIVCSLSKEDQAQFSR